MHAAALYYLGLVVLGMAVSYYVTLIGAGGGFVLMPLLLLCFPHDNPLEITAISSACLLIHTASRTAAYARIKSVDLKSGFLLGLAALPGVILGVLATGAVSRGPFEVILALFLLALSLFLMAKSWSESHCRKIALPSSHSGWNLRKTVSLNRITFQYDYNRLAGVAIFSSLGFLAGFLGIGAGSLMIPTLIYVLNLPIFIAAGTAQLIVAILSLAAAATHLALGAFTHCGMRRVMAIGIGMITGAQVGTRFSNRIKRIWAFRSLVVALALVGIKMVFDIS